MLISGVTKRDFFLIFDNNNKIFNLLPNKIKVAHFNPNSLTYFLTTFRIHYVDKINRFYEVFQALR